MRLQKKWNRWKPTDYDKIGQKVNFFTQNVELCPLRSGRPVWLRKDVPSHDMCICSLNDWKRHFKYLQSRRSYWGNLSAILDRAAQNVHITILLPCMTILLLHTVQGQNMAPWKPLKLKVFTNNMQISCRPVRVQNIKVQWLSTLLTRFVDK